MSALLSLRESLPPRSVLVLKTDTLGDVILLGPVLQALRDAWPSTRLVVLIREAYLDLAPLLAPGVEWLGTTIDPFAQGPAEAAAEVAALRQKVAGLAPEIVLAATSRRNWLEVALAAAAPAPARCLALGSVEPDPFFSAQLRIQLGLDATTVFPEVIAVSPEDPDWERNFRAADHLLGAPVARARPALALPPSATLDTAAQLRPHNFSPGRYIVCAAAGFANVQIKTWPSENFGAVLRYLRKTYGLDALLVGQENEREQLETVRAHAGGGSLWLGQPGELPQLAGLIASAAFFLGNDTGAMHLAAALDIPVVAVFGGGTWPRFVPAARQFVAVVQPLPCFGCGWQCAFGDAPCIKLIAPDEVMAACDFVRAQGNASFAEIRRVEYLSPVTRDLMDVAARRYQALHADHHIRQQKIEEKDQEIVALKAVCDEREKLIIAVHGRARALTDQLTVSTSAHALLEQALAALPADRAAAARALNDQSVHIRNLEALSRARELELAELKASVRNLDSGLHDLELAKHYGRLLAQKESAIQSLHRACAERDIDIQRLAAATTGPTAALRTFWVATRAHWRAHVGGPLRDWVFKKIVEEYWMQIGVLRHYAPRTLGWDARLPAPQCPETTLPQIAVVTPSYGQEKFIERTLRSVLDQRYPRLLYVVQDGGSQDGSAAIIERYAAQLRHWESVRDHGQADAILRGFAHVTASLLPTDLMAWLNSDDLIAPGALRFVAEYFARHPEVDVIYGHRIIIDDDDRDVGRWIMPRHDPATLEWIDYVPQETLFWRKRAWDRAGGLDPSFQFALDWDLLARFQQAGCRLVRVPYFLGAFRVHAGQKTSQAIHTTGAEEMQRIRTRFHGERQDDFASIDRHARRARLWGAITARLHDLGIRW